MCLDRLLYGTVTVRPPERMNSRHFVVTVGSALASTVTDRLEALLKEEQGRRMLLFVRLEAVEEMGDCLGVAITFSHWSGFAARPANESEGHRFRK